MSVSIRLQAEMNRVFFWVLNHAKVKNICVNMPFDSNKQNVAKSDQSFTNTIKDQLKRSTFKIHECNRIKHVHFLNR